MRRARLAVPQPVDKFVEKCRKLIRNKALAGARKVRKPIGGF
jgi:hypothetical protein